MKISHSIPLLGFLLLIAGCATSSQVQKMIDASAQADHEKSAKHEASIDVLKQSAMVALEQNKEQTAALDVLQKKLEAALSQLSAMEGSAEAAKVMSAANTVKVASLSESVLNNKESIDGTLENMIAIDNLYEEVMIRHYRRLAESAVAAIAALQVDDVVATNGVPAGLAEPIEIVAPDTTTSTNAVVE